MSEAILSPTTTKERSFFAWFEMTVVLVLIPAGLILGSLTGFAPLAPIFGMVLPISAATLFIRRRGVRWRDLCIGESKTHREISTLTLLTLGCAYGAVLASTWLLVSIFGLPGIDIGALKAAMEGNLVVYLWFLLPVAWGSAAVGEEMLMRGYFLNRLEGQLSTRLAIFLQAVIFAGLHFYQGIVGVASIFILALIFGYAYIRSGRNLLPVILAHGIIDTVSLTLIFLGHADSMSFG